MEHPGYQKEGPVAVWPIEYAEYSCFLEYPRRSAERSFIVACKRPCTICNMRQRLFVSAVRVRQEEATAKLQMPWAVVRERLRML
jgi:hypothetical protein